MLLKQIKEKTRFKNYAKAKFYNNSQFHLPHNLFDFYHLDCKRNQQFKNSELVSTQRTLHNNFTVNNVTKILPEKIQIAKGSQTLEDKAIFYNEQGKFYYKTNEIINVLYAINKKYKTLVYKSNSLFVKNKNTSTTRVNEY